MSTQPTQRKPDLQVFNIFASGIGSSLILDEVLMYFSSVLQTTNLQHLILQF